MTATTDRAPSGQSTEVNPECVTIIIFAGWRRPGESPCPSPCRTKTLVTIFVCWSSYNKFKSPDAELNVGSRYYNTPWHLRFSEVTTIDMDWIELLDETCGPGSPEGSIVCFSNVTISNLR